MKIPINILFVGKEEISVVTSILKEGGAASYYPIPIHKSPFYKSKTKLPVTDWTASHVLSLPIHPKVTTKILDSLQKQFLKYFE